MFLLANHHQDGTMSVFCKCLQIKDLSQMPAWRGRQAFNVTTYYSVYCVTHFPDFYARASRHFVFTSMKTALFVDGSQKIQLSSMKTGENVDGTGC